MERAVNMDILTFGRFYINKEMDTKEIEWYKADEDEQTILLIAKQPIVSMAFDEDLPCWDKSSIREWLNEEFFYNAFNIHEQDCIQTTNIKTTYRPDNIFATSDGSGVETEDKVFLLSAEEVEKYFQKIF